MAETKYCLYRGREYILLRYSDGRIELRDEHRDRPTLTDECGNPTSFAFVDKDEIRQVYYKHLYGVVNGYKVRILDVEDNFVYNVETSSKNVARALSLKYDDDSGLYRGYVNKTDTKVSVVKVNVRRK